MYDCLFVRMTPDFWKDFKSYMIFFYAKDLTMEDVSNTIDNMVNDILGNSSVSTITETQFWEMEAVLKEIQEIELLAKRKIEMESMPSFDLQISQLTPPDYKLSHPQHVATEIRVLRVIYYFFVHKCEISCDFSHTKQCTK
jgi:hypothetical protein